MYIKFRISEEIKYHYFLVEGRNAYEIMICNKNDNSCNPSEIITKLFNNVLFVLPLIRCKNIAKLDLKKVVTLKVPCECKNLIRFLYLNNETNKDKNKKDESNGKIQASKCSSNEEFYICDDLVEEELDISELEEEANFWKFINIINEFVDQYELTIEGDRIICIIPQTNNNLVKIKEKISEFKLDDFVDIEENETPKLNIEIKNKPSKKKVRGRK